MATAQVDQFYQSFRAGAAVTQEQIPTIARLLQRKQQAQQNGQKQRGSHRVAEQQGAQRQAALSGWGTCGRHLRGK
ncbi:hypothetical protein GCM10008940_20430 [Microbulbifer agarilyticus]